MGQFLFIISMLCFCVAAYIGFEKTTYSVLESDGMVNVCLTVDRGDGTEEFEVYLYIANLTTQG